MHRLIVIVAVLAFSASVFARDVRAGSSSSSRSREKVADLGNMTGTESNEIPKPSFEEISTPVPTTTQSIRSKGTLTMTPATTTASILIAGETKTTTKKMAFRKRRASNAIANPGKSKSASQENGSGKDSSNSIGQDAKLIDSKENLSNCSDQGDFDGSTTVAAPVSGPELSSNEIGSGEDEASVNPSSNQLLGLAAAESAKIAMLENKVKSWQKTVDNYLQTETLRRRKRQQSTWSQLFPSSSGTNSVNGPNSFASAPFAVGDALKPAMELMSQGVNLLSDLYTTQFSKPAVRSFTRLDPIGATSNDTIAADQFRDQLRLLQSRLGDLGNQLQHVVSSFQQMPFFDQLLSSGFAPADAPPSNPQKLVEKEKNQSTKLKN